MNVVSIVSLACLASGFAIAAAEAANCPNDGRNNPAFAMTGRPVTDPCRSRPGLGPDRPKPPEATRKITVASRKEPKGLTFRSGDTVFCVHGSVSATVASTKGRRLRPRVDRHAEQTCDAD